jgi:hypothetical protein
LIRFLWRCSGNGKWGRWPRVLRPSPNPAIPHALTTKIVCPLPRNPDTAVRQQKAIEDEDNSLRSCHRRNSPIVPMIPKVSVVVGRVAASGDQELDVQLDRSSLPTTNQLSPPVVLRRWSWCSLWRIFVEEFCNLPYRMAEVRRICALERRGYTDSDRPGFASALASPSRLWRHAYIRYMQQLPPQLTIFDRLLVERAWKAGLEWSVHTDTLRSQTNSSSGGWPTYGCPFLASFARSGKTTAARS